MFLVFNRGEGASHRLWRRALQLRRARSPFNFSSQRFWYSAVEKERAAGTEGGRSYYAAPVAFKFFPSTIVLPTVDKERAADFKGGRSYYAAPRSPLPLNFSFNVYVADRGEGASRRL